ncbi:MAG: hypothetical protein R3338_01870, partial [Thermoanaerobaculia bacterium]|nr:hypothetical protein [Thermoanaerobaculia bacterium]
GFVFWTFLKGRQIKRAKELQAEIQQKMLDRFGSSQDLIAFLQTSEGNRYLEKLAEQPVASPLERTLSSIRTGTIITFLSAGLVVTGAMLGHELSENGALILGLVGVFLGVGFLVSGFASQRLARQWGMIEDQQATNAGA